MNKIIIVICVALGLGACTALDNISTAVKVATVSVTNPVTKQDLYNFENGMIIAFAGLNAYKRVCVNGTIPDSCKDTIRSIQVYTRQIPPLLTQARGFVKNNDQVNATVVYNQMVALFNQFKAIAIANNIKVQ